MIFVIIFTFSYIVNRNYQQFIKILSVTFCIVIFHRICHAAFSFSWGIRNKHFLFSWIFKAKHFSFSWIFIQNFSYFREYRLLFVENYITIKLIKRWFKWLMHCRKEPIMLFKRKLYQKLKMERNIGRFIRSVDRRCKTNRKKYHCRRICESRIWWLYVIGLCTRKYRHKRQLYK